MNLKSIIEKLKGLFIKPEPKVEAPIVDVKPAEAKKTRKKAAKKVTK